MTEDEVNYELNTEDSYIGTEEVKKNFYIFNIAAPVVGDLADYNYAVKKSDLSVYYGDTYGMLIPYEDYINEDSKLRKFLSDYWQYGKDYPDNQVHIEFNKLGAEKFLDKIIPILKDSDEGTVGYYGDYVQYVSLILSGSTKEELDGYVENRLNPENILKEEYTAIDYDMEPLYKEYAKYEYDKETIDSIFNEGWLEGFDYVILGHSIKKEDIEEYIYINSPEHIGGIIWTEGFWHGYNQFKETTEDTTEIIN